MPELPDLVHVEAGLRAAVVGKRIASARTGDPTVLRIMVTEPFPAVLAGRTLAGVERRGHFMRFALDSDLVVVVNAMLVGRYRLVPPRARRRAAKAKKDPRSLGLALVFEGAPELHYLDDKRMGKVYVARAADEATIPIYGQLGADVLSPAFTREAFGKLIARRRDQVRAFLMDKRALASIGNAYADEILFAAGLHPKTFCNKLAPADVDALHAAIGRVLTDAIAEIRAARRADRDQGPRLPQGARPRRQAVRRLRHDDPRGARRRRRRLLLPALPARDAQAVRQLDTPQRRFELIDSFGRWRGDGGSLVRSASAGSAASPDDSRLKRRPGITSLSAASRYCAISAYVPSFGSWSVTVSIPKPGRCPGGGRPRQQQAQSRARPGMAAVADAEPRACQRLCREERPSRARPLPRGR